MPLAVTIGILITMILSYCSCPAKWKEYAEDDITKAIRIDLKKCNLSEDLALHRLELNGETNFRQGFNDNDDDDGDDLMLLR